MKLDYFTYKIPFTHPFHTAHQMFSYREGIIIKLQKDGLTALGEAAPLPGFSKGDNRVILEQFRQHQQKIISLFESSFSLNDIKNFLRARPFDPSLQFGLFTLAATFLAQKRETTLQKLLFLAPQKEVPVNAVFGTNSVNMKDIDQCVTQGITTIKLKVGEEGAFGTGIKGIRKRYPDLSLRIDANQSWSLSQATRRLQRVAPFNIEYCEEPLAHPDSRSIAALGEVSPVPIALDESVTQTFSLEQALKRCSFLIIKPAVLGLQGMERNILNEAIDHQTKLIFTTSLGSGIERLMTASLASGLGTPNTAHGLATGSMLASDIWRDDQFITDGRFMFPGTAHLSALMNSDFSEIVDNKM
jgi:o-succinylbenzoate synthase